MGGGPRLGSGGIGLGLLTQGRHKLELSGLGRLQDAVVRLALTMLIMKTMMLLRLRLLMMNLPLSWTAWEKSVRLSCSTKMARQSCSSSPRITADVINILHFYKN